MGRLKYDHIKGLITLTSDNIKRLSLYLNNIMYFCNRNYKMRWQLRRATKSTTGNADTPSCCWPHRKPQRQIGEQFLDSSSSFLTSTLHLTTKPSSSLHSWAAPSQKKSLNSRENVARLCPVMPLTLNLAKMLHSARIPLSWFITQYNNELSLAAFHIWRAARMIPMCFINFFA